MPPSSHRWGARTLLLGLALFGLSMMLSRADVLTEEAEALPMHSIEVSLYPQELTAKVTNDQLGAVTFGGNVTIEKPGGVETLEVTLQANCARGWPVVICPTTIPFINPGTEQFTVTVVVPPGTAPISSAVTAVAHAHNPIWDETDSAEATVSVDQYYQFRIWLEGNSADARPGDTVGGTLTIFNNGTGEDRFLISLENTPAMITNLDVDNSVTVPSKFEMAVDFTLTIAEDYEPDSGGELLTIIFKVESEGVRNLDHLMSHTEPFYIHFAGWGENLVENWTTYAGYAAAVVVVVIVTFFIVKWRRRGRIEVPEAVEA